MANPKYVAMAQALSQAGFTGDALVKMVAIGIAESLGDPSVINDNPLTGDYSVGWFQINYFGNLAASRTARYGPPETLRGNPSAQAAAAWDLSNHGTNFQPWIGDVWNGKIARFTPAAKEAVTAMSDPSQQATLVADVPGTNWHIPGTGSGSGAILPDNPFGAMLAPFTTIAKLFGKLADPHFWLRIGEFAAGAVLLILGVVWMGHESGVNDAVKAGVKKTAGTVAKVAEVAAVA